MKTLGIVSEYNPFHNGHKYHINRSLEMSRADILICIMSGNFVERGEPAILDKWTRSKIAILNGANLVIELPTLYATQNAGIFAKGAIEILEQLGCENISFGIEETSKDKLIEISDFLINNNEIIEQEVKIAKKTGLTYPEVRENIVLKKMGDDYTGILDKPNNILAIEYLKNIKKSTPIFIDRYLVNHNESENENIASGKYIRELLKQEKDVSKYIPYNLQKNIFIFKENLYNEFISIAMNNSSDYLNCIFGAEEGLGSIIKNKFRYWDNYSDIIKDLKSKSYTETRINRVILNSILGIKKENINNAKNYARILAFDEKGQKYIKYLKKSKVDIPILTNINKENVDEIKETLDFDIKASDLYNKISGKNLYKNSDFVVMPSRF